MQIKQLEDQLEDEYAEKTAAVKVSSSSTVLSAAKFWREITGWWMNVALYWEPVAQHILAGETGNSAHCGG